MKVSDPNGNLEFFLRKENAKERAYARHEYVEYNCPGTNVNSVDKLGVTFVVFASPGLVLY